MIQSMTISLLQTLAASQAESSERVAGLVRTHAGMVFRLAFSVLRNHADAEDAAQETFLRVMRHAADLDKVEDERRWIASIAWRIALDRVRKHSDQSLDDVGMALERLRAEDPDALASLEQQQKSALLRQLIDTLPKEIKQVVLLSTVNELTSTEIAKIVGIPEGSVRQRMFRAREMMRAKLVSMMKHGKKK